MWAAGSALGVTTACGAVVGAASSVADEHAALNNVAPTVSVAQPSNEVLEYRRIHPI